MVATRTLGNRSKRPWQTMAAMVQVSQAGNPDQVAKAAHLLKETKRNLYRILAEEETAPGGSTSA